MFLVFVEWCGECVCRFVCCMTLAVIEAVIVMYVNVNAM